VRIGSASDLYCAATGGGGEGSGHLAPLHESVGKVAFIPHSSLSVLHRRSLCARRFYALVEAYATAQRWSDPNDGKWRHTCTVTACASVVMVSWLPSKWSQNGSVRVKKNKIIFFLMVQLRTRVYNSNFYSQDLLRQRKSHFDLGKLGAPSLAQPQDPVRCRTCMAQRSLSGR
jgi:hypothetical protein